MSDIRHHLNARLVVLRDRADQDRETIASTYLDKAVREIAQSNLNELFHIESTLATYQLADAQMELVAAQTAATTAQEKATAEQRKANDAADKAKGKSEETQFWSRRYLTNLLVGNAAGFVAVLTFMLKEDSPRVPPEDVSLLLTCFGFGALLGGLMPLFRLVEINVGSGLHKLADQPNPRTTRVGRFYSDNGLNMVGAIGGTLLFGLGLMILIGCARGYYENRPPEVPKETRVVVAGSSLPQASSTTTAAKLQTAE